MIVVSDGGKDQTIQPPKLLDATSEFALTYEDKEGDWMLVGDVPWGYVASLSFNSLSSSSLFSYYNVFI